MVPDLEIPGAPTEVGPGWVDTALRRHGRVECSRVARLSVEPICKGLGALSQVARLHLTYEDEDRPGPAKVVLKLVSTYPEVLRGAANLRMYEREVAFYRFVAPQGGVPAPVCYWAAFDPSTGRFGILIEDLGSLASEDELTGISSGRLSMCTAALADVHAHWWASPVLETYEWLPRLGEGPVDESYGRLWPLFFERFGPTLPSGSSRFDVAAPALNQVFDVWACEPSTLVHGDFKVDNLFFGEVPERVVVIDWQLAFRGPGVFDLAYLLTRSTAVELRRAREWEELRSWHDRVRSQVTTTYSFEDTVADYRRSALVGVLYCVVGAQAIDPDNTRGERLFTKIVQRAFCAAIDLGLQDLLS